MQIPDEYIENLIKDAKLLVHEIREDDPLLDKTLSLLVRVIDLESLIK